MKPIEFALVASRDYLKNHGVPRRWTATTSWATPTRRPSPKTGRWRLNNTALMAQLAAPGTALATLPRLLLPEYPELQVVLPEVRMPRATLFAVTHGRRHQTARVRTFLDYLQAQL